jgi:hypothetical protein
MSFVDFKSNLIKILLTNSITSYNDMNPGQMRNATNSYFQNNLR